jgi:putative oxygen-independent coproporphyrinogen III oxidase
VSDLIAQSHVSRGGVFHTIPASSEKLGYLSIYVNIPFCNSRCSFCDYVSNIPSKDLLLKAKEPRRQKYIDSLCDEIKQKGAEPSIGNKEPVTLYWGGGTASALDHDEIKQVMDAIKASFNFKKLMELTIECSPDSLTEEKVKLFKEVGFNRLSLGVQSFDDVRLKSLGRRHNSSQTHQAIEWVRSAGFDNVSIDLMCGFPDENLEELQTNVQMAIDAKVEHVSLYPYRVTNGTAMRRMIDKGKLDLYVSLQKRNYFAGKKMLMDAGYNEYAYGYFGDPVLFNVMYFQMRGDTIGFGSGAVSLLDGGYLTHKKGDLDGYMNEPAAYSSKTLSTEDPFLISAIRAGLTSKEGILKDQWMRVINIDLDEAFKRPALKSLVDFLYEKGMVVDDLGARLPEESYTSTLIELSYQLFKSEPSSNKNPEINLEGADLIVAEGQA